MRRRKRSVFFMRGERSTLRFFLTCLRKKAAAARLVCMAILALLLLLQTAADASEVSACQRMENDARLDEAVACYERLLAVATDPAGRFHIHTRIGWIRAGNADYENGLAHFHDALAIGRSLED